MESEDLLRIPLLWKSGENSSEFLTGWLITKKYKKWTSQTKIKF